MFIPFLTTSNVFLIGPIFVQLILIINYFCLLFFSLSSHLSTFQKLVFVQLTTKNGQRGTTPSGGSSAGTASSSTGRTTPSWAPSRPRVEPEVRTTFLILDSAPEPKTRVIRGDPGRRTGASSRIPRPHRHCDTCLLKQHPEPSLTMVSSKSS